MELCKISAGASANCNKPLVGGANDRLILINKEDISGVVYSASSDLIIEAITLAIASPANKAYAFTGKNSSVDSSATLVKGRYSVTYDHQTIFRIFDDGPDIREIVAQLGNGKYVAIVQNNYRGTDDKATFDVKGISVGLEATEITQDKSDADTQGAWVITLKTPDNGPKEPLPPANFFITDYATTKAAIDALL